MFVRWQPHNWAEARTLLSAGGAGGEGGGGGGGNEGRTKERASDLVDRYNGDAVKMAEKLADALNDNYTLRRKRDDLQGEVTTLTGNQKPEGAVILLGDEAGAYEAYKGLGKPDEIKTKLEQVDTLASELGGMKREATIRQVAEVAGYKPAVLTRLGGDREYVIKDETADDKPIKRAYVKTEQGDKPLADYAAAEWGDFLPALTATNAAQQGQQSGGVRYPAQGGGGAPPPANAADAFFAQKYPSRG